eukprot:CAMPEP_0178533912 /NCGR_PEP_ID=MMETSP0696-20121128/34739_1 /TAXON_ID=265572 /ORGANISM="Extubocellulus spinifer, Strain CCMP396" /LENGTH=848 /DNA_ID=CAMNT_0020165965 /DNA_START=239 /DNA_END=2785 /DNA_ORIENTATION=+
MKIETPQILWHNGTESDNGKAAPLYSCSLLPVADEGTTSTSTSSSSSNHNVLATVGNTPEVHIWEVGFSRSDGVTVNSNTGESNKVGSKDANETNNDDGGDDPTASARQQQRSRILQKEATTSIKHVLTLSRQIDRSLNAVKFSPDGKHLAAAGDGGVVLVFTLPPSHLPVPSSDPTKASIKNGRVWCGRTPGLADEKSLRTKLLPSPSTHDVMDLSWSEDSKRLAVACLDHTVVIYENVHYDTLTTDEEPKWSIVHRSTSDHLGYVQGVAFDPKGVYLASQGSDRTVRVWSRKKKAIERQEQQRQEQPQQKPESQVEKDSKDKMPLADADPNSAAAEAAVAATAPLGSADSSGIANTTVATESSGDTADNGADDTAPDDGRPQQQPELGSDEQNKETSASTSSSEPDSVMVTDETPQDKLAMQARMNVSARTALTNGKFELGKAKIIKFRDNGATNNANANNSKTPSDQQQQQPQQHQEAVDQEAKASTRRHHLFGDESTVESFFRRLCWTADGAFLICPSALWHCAKKSAKSGAVISQEGQDDKEDEEHDQGPSYATCLFSRHAFDQPCRVLAGLEKPSVVVRPNPVLFKLPPNANASSKENDVPSTSEGNSPPYRSIFAVLTLDSVVVYDTHHAHPLCIARGLHYAGLTDAVWSSDGRTLMVSSTDGYISIINFADGELGEVYVPPLALAEAKVLQEEAVKMASRTIAATAASAPSLPPCEPGQSSVIVGPPAKKAKTDMDAPKAVSVTPNGCDAAQKEQQKSGKKRVVPTLVPVRKVENLSLEGDSGANNQETTADGEIDMANSSDDAAASTAMTTTKTNDEEPNILQPKKKKKRVQPVLVSCD